MRRDEAQPSPRVGIDLVSGAMFEYYAGLLDAARGKPAGNTTLVVARQIATRPNEECMGHFRRVTCAIGTDVSYRALVCGPRTKRLSEDVVVAPYATVLAPMSSEAAIEPRPPDLAARRAIRIPEAWTTRAAPSRRRERPHRE